MRPIPPLRFTVEIENPDAFKGVDLERLKLALRTGALFAGEWIRGTWIQVAQRLDVRGSGEYLAGIQSNGRVEVVREEEVGDTFEVVVEVVNTAAHASVIEDGHAAFHLPSTIDWARMTGRIKRTKEGRPYLHIPFRHTAHASASQQAAKGYTRGARKAMMPQDVYQQAKQLTFTQRLGVGPIHTAKGQFVQADRYNWGTRLSRLGIATGTAERRGATLAGTSQKNTPMVNPAWKGSRFSGMFRTGSEGHSSYMTIRTMTADSKGWNMPARKGLHIAEKVARAAEGREVADLVNAQMLAVLAGGAPGTG